MTSKFPISPFSEPGRFNAVPSGSRSTTFYMLKLKTLKVLGSCLTISLKEANLNGCNDRSDIGALTGGCQENYHTAIRP